MADMWRTRMRTAMINESPREITEVLDAAKHLADGGEGVKAERRLLEERLNMLTKKAAQELRSRGRAKDFKAVQEAIEKYGLGTGYRPLSGTHTLHVELEAKIATFNGTEAAETFSRASGKTTPSLRSVLSASSANRARSSPP